MSLEADFDVADGLLGADDTARFAGVPLERSQSERSQRAVIAFVGMAFEARIAAGPGVLVLTRHSRRELSMAAKRRPSGYRGMISFGVAGGLASDLRPGDWVVASAIVKSDTTRSTDAAWSGSSATPSGRKFRSDHRRGRSGGRAAKKRELHRTTGAAAVDMESHVVARVAAAHGLAFTALRVIVDPADRTIPPAALLGMGPGARTDGAAVLRELIARPSQLSAFSAYRWMPMPRAPKCTVCGDCSARISGWLRRAARKRARLCGAGAGGIGDWRLTLAGLKQIEFAAQHEIETAGAPFAGGVAHQRRLFAVAPHNGIRPRRSSSASTMSLRSLAAGTSPSGTAARRTRAVTRPAAPSDGSKTCRPASGDRMRCAPKPLTIRSAGLFLSSPAIR